MNYADINHRAGTAESQLYSNAEAFRCLADTTTEYTEIKQSHKVGEYKAVPSSRRWVESWGGWATGWVGWVGRELQWDMPSWGANDPG